MQWGKVLIIVDSLRIDILALSELFNQTSLNSKKKKIEFVG